MITPPPRSERPTPSPGLASERAPFAAAFKTALAAREQALHAIPAERVIDALARAAADWRDPEYAPRIEALRTITGVSGWHPEMLSTGVDFVFSAVTRESLCALVQMEAGSTSALSPPAKTRRVGPKVIFHALAGNVPGLGIPPILASLLACSIVILRDSERQPALTDAFRATLAGYEPALGAMVLPVAWRRDGDGRGLEDEVLAVAERIELYGSDETLGPLSHRYGESGRASIRLHGSRVSLGLVAVDAELSTAADRFAVDVAMYEGRGCLSPHVILVEGGRARAVEFARVLAAALAALEKRWPRARGTLAEEASRRVFIDEGEIATLDAGTQRQCWVGDAGSWCVRLEAVREIAPGPGLRCVTVAAIDGEAGESGRCLQAPIPIAGVGIAAARESDLAPHLGRLASCAPGLALALRGSLALGAGRMQAPPLAWRQDGGRRLADLLGDAS